MENTKKKLIISKQTNYNKLWKVVLIYLMYSTIDIYVGSNNGLCFSYKRLVLDRLTFMVHEFTRCSHAIDRADVGCQCLPMLGKVEQWTFSKLCLLVSVDCLKGNGGTERDHCVPTACRLTTLQEAFLNSTVATVAWANKYMSPA